MRTKQRNMVFSLIIYAVMAVIALAVLMLVT